MQLLNQENRIENELFELAQKKVKKRKDFFIHLFIYTIGITIWLLKKYTNAPLNFFPIRYINWIVIAIWTVAFVFQAIEMLISEIVFGKKWEDKQIKNIMDDASKKQTWE